MEAMETMEDEKMRWNGLIDKCHYSGGDNIGIQMM